MSNCSFVSFSSVRNISFELLIAPTKMIWSAFLLNASCVALLIRSSDCVLLTAKKRHLVIDQQVTCLQTAAWTVVVVTLLALVIPPSFRLTPRSPCPLTPLQIFKSSEPYRKSNCRRAALDYLNHAFTYGWTFDSHKEFAAVLFLLRFILPCCFRDFDEVALGYLIRALCSIATEACEVANSNRVSNFRIV